MGSAACRERFLAGVLLGIVNTVSSYYIGSYITTIMLLLAAAITIVLRPPACWADLDDRSADEASDGASVAAGVRADRASPAPCWPSCRCATATRAR